MKRAAIPVVIAVCFGIAGSASAQSANQPKITFIHVGQLFDSEHGTFLRSQDIVVKDNVIEAVGANLAVPAGAQVIDLGRYTVLPGLIDAHSHLLSWVKEGDLWGENLKARMLSSVFGFGGSAMRLLRAAGRARSYLEAGITTIRDLGDSGRFLDVALRDAIAEGSVDGPRMVVSGPGLLIQCAPFAPDYQYLSEEEYRPIKGPLDAAQAVRDHYAQWVDLIKVYSGSCDPGGEPLMTLEEMKAIVQEAASVGPEGDCPCHLRCRRAPCSGGWRGLH